MQSSKVDKVIRYGRFLVCPGALHAPTVSMTCGIPLTQGQIRMDGGPLHQENLPSSMAFDVTLGHRSLAPQFASERLAHSYRFDMQSSAPEK